MAIASYYTPTHVLMGKGAYKEVVNELKKQNATKVLIHYGSDRIKKNGLLDEVVREMKGMPVKEEIDVQIDLDVTSYIPDEYISDSSQKIEMYQDIALCRNEEDIQNVIDEMAKELRYQLAQRGDLYCVNFCENEKKCNINNCIEGIKQYFYKKVRNNGIKRK